MSSHLRYSHLIITILNKYTVKKNNNRHFPLRNVVFAHFLLEHSYINTDKQTKMLTFTTQSNIDYSLSFNRFFYHVCFILLLY